MGLNETYASSRAQILLMDPLPSITKVFSLHQRNNADPNVVETASFLAATDNKKGNNDRYKKKDGQRSPPICVNRGFQDCCHTPTPNRHFDVKHLLLL